MRRNLVPNPSFETGTGGWGLTVTGADSGYSVSRESVSLGVSGSYGARILTNNFNFLTVKLSTSALVGVTAGATYTGSAYVYRADAAGNVRLDLDWYTAGDVFISTTSATTSVSSLAWTRVSVTGAAPANAAKVRAASITFLGVNVAFQRDEEYVDAVMLEEGPLASYSDGDSPGWVWDGAANASASREAFADYPASTLQRVLGSQVQLSDGTHAFLEYNDAPDGTLDSGALRLRHHNGTSAVDIATLSLGESSGFALGMRGGMQSFALTRDAANNLYVLSRLGGSSTQVAAQAFTKGSGYTWTARSVLSQQMGIGSVGAPDGWAAAWHAAGGTAGTLVAIMSRTTGGTVEGQMGALLLNCDALLAGSGTLLRGTGTFDALFTAPAGSTYQNPYLTGVDVAASSATRGYAVTWNRDGDGASWSRYTLNAGGTGFDSTAEASTTSGVYKHESSKARVVALSDSAFVVATAATSGVVRLTAYQNLGAATALTELGTETIGGSGAGAETTIASFPNLTTVGAAWDIDYDPSAGRIWVYYFDAANPRRLLRTGWSTVTYLADGVAVDIAPTVGDSGSTQRAIRVHRGSSAGSTSLVTVANQTSSGVHSSIYVLDQHNVAPTAPTPNTVGNFDGGSAKAFTWTFNDPNVGDTQSAYQLQIQTNLGAARYDTGKTTSTSSSHTLPAGTLSNPGSWQWLVKTWDALGVESPWSAVSSFATQSGGSVAITTPPSDNPTEATNLADWLIVWVVTGTTQDAYRVTVVNNDTGAQLSTTGWVSSTDTQRTVTLPSSVEWRIEVTVRSAGVESGTAARLITPTYGDPMTPTGTAVADPERAFVLITVTNPTPEGDRPEVARNDIYRRRSGTGATFVLVGSTDLNGTFRDYGAASGVAYDYFVRGVSA